MIGARATQRGGAVYLVLWLGSEQLDAIDFSTPSGSFPDRIYLSSTLTDGAPGVGPLSALADRAFQVHPFELPSRMDRRTLRTRSWLKSERLPLEDLRIQANTFFAVSALGEGVRHIKNIFLRDNLVERLCALHRAGHTLVLVPHDAALAARVASSAIVLGAGRVTHRFDVLPDAGELERAALDAGAGER